ncbi:hypothetical protein KP509_27G063700 [Ceratopteris richardii]|uniref:ATP synthase F1 complex delta/epsilon subunit N-terminal domain-containing protein n=1 Tax=Ceratopteris richardii TaxID=49495 RepID=A0A8T2RGW6_CERRI|nr:hypothetical protein KP509_27G063700 [Ceratopteris richardii]
MPLDPLCESSLSVSLSLSIVALIPHGAKVWNSKVGEIILSTKSDQIRIAPNHAPLLITLHMEVSKIHSGGQWSTMASMGDFAMIDNNRVTILVNEAEVSDEIDPIGAQKDYDIAPYLLGTQFLSRNLVRKAHLRRQLANTRMKVGE